MHFAVLKQLREMYRTIQALKKNNNILRHGDPENKKTDEAKKKRSFQVIVDG